MRFARRHPLALPLDPLARVSASTCLLPCAVVAFVLVWVAMEGVAESEPAASPDRTAAHGTGVLTPENVEPAEAADEPPAEAKAEADVDVDVDADVDVEAGEIIVVTGTRSERPQSSSPVTTEVVSREQIEESGAVTVADALAQRAGLWID